MSTWFRVTVLILITIFLIFEILSGQEPNRTAAIIVALFLLLFGIFIRVRKKIKADSQKE
jgi:membrane protein DedA with SNARE-associated domain